VLFIPYGEYRSKYFQEIGYALRTTSERIETNFYKSMVYYPIMILSLGRLGGHKSHADPVSAG